MNRLTTENWIFFLCFVLDYMLHFLCFSLSLSFSRPVLHFSFVVLQFLISLWLVSLSLFQTAYPLRSVTLFSMRWKSQSWLCKILLQRFCFFLCESIANTGINRGNMWSKYIRKYNFFFRNICIHILQTYSCIQKMLFSKSHMNFMRFCGLALENARFLLWRVKIHFFYFLRALLNADLFLLCCLKN